MAELRLQPSSNLGAMEAHHLAGHVGQSTPGRRQRVVWHIGREAEAVWEEVHTALCGEKGTGYVDPDEASLSTALHAGSGGQGGHTCPLGLLPNCTALSDQQVLDNSPS